MVVVYIPGVFDLLHVGHVTTLRRAACFGDKLVVGVPSDEVVIEDKGDLPIIPLIDRLEMLQSLKFVDSAIPYYELEFITHLDMIRPDILTVGSTWGCDRRHLDAEKWVKDNHRRFIKLPYCEYESTTDIKRRVTKQCQAT